MKKLIAIIALVACATVANAACVNWKITGAAADNGANVYIVLGATAAASFDSLDALKDVAVGGESQGTVAKKSGKYQVAGTLNDPAFTTANNKFYYVLVSSDEKSFYISPVQTAESANIYNEGETAGTALSATLASSYSDFSGGSPVPEPTSGMMLVLGVAALALKRKQA